LEGNQVRSQFPQEALKCGRLQILVLEVAGISNEDIEGNRDVFLGETLREHVFHEEIDLID